MRLTLGQLRHLLETLEDYTPPLDLLAKLTPSAPYRARQIREEAGGKKGWWKGKGKEDADLFGDAGKELVKVLSGEEELANLKTPKVSRSSRQGRISELTRTRVS